MATAATIGALRVVLGADTAAFETGMKNAESRLSKFSANIGKVAAGIGVAMAGAAVAFGVAVKGAIDRADELGKMAQSIGIPVEELSKLKHAADLSGVSLETLSKSMTFLSRAMTEAAAGAKGPATQAFNALRISVTNADGSLKSSTQVMSEIADRFAKMQDGAAKTAIRVALLGRGSAEMAALLNLGADGLNRMFQEAERLGLVIDTRTAKAAEDFNDNLTRLGKVKDGIINKIIGSGGMVQALAQLSDWMVKTANDAELVKQIADSLTSAFRFTVETAISLAVGLQRVGAELAALVEAGKLFAQLEFSKGLQTFNAAGDETIRVMEALKQRLATMWDAPVAEIAAKAPDLANKMAAPIMGAGKLIEDQRKKAAANVASIEAEQQEIMERFRTPAEAMAADVQKITDAFARGVITQEQFALVSERLAMRIQAVWGNAAATIVGAFGDIAGSFGKENAAMAKTAQILGAAQALIATLVGQAEALKLPFPANLAAAAVIAAKGFALVAAIKSTPIGMAEGGSFVVPGGQSFTDNVMLPMGLASGERVDVTRDRSGGGDRELVIPSIRPKDFFTGETVRVVINSIDQWVRDGGSGIRWKTA